MQNKSTTYRAAWLFPVDRPPIENGFVTVAGGIIQAVGRISGSTKSEIAPEVVDVGDVAMIPALVNAHTHLEFSHLKRPLGHPGIEFTDWIREIVASRRASSMTAEDKHRSIRMGISESIECGVGCIGEIATMPIQVVDYCPATQPEMPMEIVVFREELGLDPLAIAEKENVLRKFLNDSMDPTVAPNGAKLDRLSVRAVEKRSETIIGLSPHAPYSVHPDLQRMLVNLAKEHQRPLAMHLAETRAERELLDFGTGCFVRLLQDFGVWNDLSFQHSMSVFDSLRLLSQSCKALIVHGNYLADDELRFIAENRQTLSVVFCPRTHQYFGHEPYPLIKMLELGVQLAIGTDSRGSSPNLNLLDELKLVQFKFPGLKSSDVLKMGTLNGATALGLDGRLGSLTPNKRAMISAVGSEQKSDAANLFESASWCSRIC